MVIEIKGVPKALGSETIKAFKESLQNHVGERKNQVFFDADLTDIGQMPERACFLCRISPEPTPHAKPQIADKVRKIVRAHMDSEIGFDIVIRFETVISA